jgi:hypothetical protein
MIILKMNSIDEGKVTEGILSIYQFYVMYTTNTKS